MRHFLKTAAMTALTALLLSGGVRAARTEFLIPGGETIGLRLQTDGVSVVEFAEDNPCAKSAGLKKGDLICTINGTEVSTVQEITKLVEQTQGQALTITVKRGEERKTLRFAPQKTKDGWRLGVYVRDGVNGIGTVTYYDPASGAFGALGHGVGDSGSAPLPLRKGTVFSARVASVIGGKAGDPGALQGAVTSKEAIGVIEKNTERGIFGSIAIPREKKAVPVARAGEVHTGSASIYSCVSGQTTHSYEIRILEIDLKEAHGRNFLIEISDPALLAQTGGIVQGMSGSPIMQDGKLIGAVTHVLVNEPTRGYGIFIENMLEAAQEPLPRAA